MLQVSSDLCIMSLFVSNPIDYIVPPSENNAIFIMTNFIRTDQSRSFCPESISLKEAACDKDLDCQNRPYIPNVNGRWTGRCLVNTSTNTSTNTNTNTNTTRRPMGLCEMEGIIISISSSPNRCCL